MTIWSAIGRQLRHPTGPVGWTAGHLMGLLNARPNALSIAALNLQATDDILELGCGPGHGVRLMAAQSPRSVICAIDQSATMIAQARRTNRDAIRSGRVRLYRGTFEELPFPNRSMDKILAVNVVYFWRDAETVLREVRRVLRPNGVLSVYVTDAQTMRRWKFAEPQTHRLFDRDELAGMLRLGGFYDEPIAVASIQLLWGITGLIGTVGTGHDHRREPAPPAT
ncbi:MAG: class I SAM-dependent methyltransferase [Stellaceae bacterium]